MMYIGEEHDRNLCVVNLETDTELIQSMKMLAASGVKNIICKEDTLVCICWSLSCDAIMVMKVQSNKSKTISHQIYKAT